MPSKVPTLAYDPGVMPTYPAPVAGDEIRIELSGLPPFKQVRASLRNPKDKNYDRFVALRRTATIKMESREWYRGPIAMDFTLWAPKGLKECSRNDYADGRQCSLPDYFDGIMDALDGSHGPSFTYLPIVYEDDCQIAICRASFLVADTTGYSVVVRFL